MKMIRNSIAIFLLILCINFNVSNFLNVDFIFSLQEYFKSDLILLAKESGNEKLAIKLLKCKEARPKVFTAVLNVRNDVESLFSSPFFSGYENVIVIVNNVTDFIGEFVKIQNANPTLVTKFLWINFIRTEYEIHLLNSSLIIPYESQFFLVKEIHNNNYEIIDIYQISFNSPKIYSSCGVWENNELKFRYDLFSKRINLKGYHLKIISSPVTAAIAGLHLWNELSTWMNFSLNVLNIPQTGREFPNGTKTGMFKSIYNHEVEGGTDNFAVTTTRMRDYDFIYPTKLTQSKLYVEVKQGLNWTSFITPFKIDVWILVIIWIVLVSFLMEITNRVISPWIKFRFEDIIFNIIMAFCNQGRHFRSNRFSFCVYVFMPYLLAFVLFHHYSGLLLAHITIKDDKLPFKNLKGVINDGTYELALSYPSFTWAYFDTNNDTESEGVRKLLLPKEKLTFFSEGPFHDLCKHRRVFLTNTFNFNVRVNCNVVELPDAILFQTFGIIVEKGFWYKKVMLKLIKRLQAGGISKFNLKNFVKEREEDYNIQPLELETVFPAFLILICFLFASLLILLREVITWRWKKS